MPDRRDRSAERERLDAMHRLQRVVDRIRLQRAVDRMSQGSADHFAAQFVLRNATTVRRWLRGESPIPAEVRAKLREWEP